MSARRRRKAPEGSPVGGYQVGPGTVVALSYELFDAEGERVEASEPGEPLALIVGYGDASPALEQAIQGLSVGDVREIRLDPEDAFGLRNPQGIIEVDRTDLPRDIAPGDELEAEREDGAGLVTLKVLEVGADRVVLDTNHPLAGQRVRLRVAVETVRPASDLEIAGATERLMGAAATDRGPLLPAERLLKRGRGVPARLGDEPPPHPTRVA